MAQEHQDEDSEVKFYTDAESFFSQDGWDGAEPHVVAVGFARDVVRSIISGMEARLIILRAEARQGTNHRERISELTNWVAGLKKEYLEK